jgi:hypothetical protein
LLAVEGLAAYMASCRSASMKPLWKLYWEIEARAVPRRRGLEPALLRTASPSAVKSWPELAEWRGLPDYDRPLVLWVHTDYLNCVA